MRNPKTRGEWQAAVNLASKMLDFAAASDFGLLQAGFVEVDVERCFLILRRGMALQVFPRAEPALAYLQTEGQAA